MSKKLVTPEDVRAFALASYEVEYAEATDEAKAKGLSPAKATKGAKERGYATPASIVALVYFRENGLRNPLPIAADAKPATIAAAARKRRKAGGTLARFETLAASTSAALGRTVSENETRALLYDGPKAGRIDPTRDYSGRGTRELASATRADVALALDSSK